MTELLVSFKIEEIQEGGNMLILIEEAGEFLGVSPATVREWTRRGIIKRYGKEYKSEELSEVVKRYPLVTCQRCDHVWVRKTPGLPTRCKKCSSTRLSIQLWRKKPNAID